MVGTTNFNLPITLAYKDQRHLGEGKGLWVRVFWSPTCTSDSLSRLNGPGGSDYSTISSYCLSLGRPAGLALFWFTPGHSFEVLHLLHSFEGLVPL